MFHLNYIDIHTHKIRKSANIQIVDISERVNVDIEICSHYSMGVHPWFVKEMDLDKKMQNIKSHIDKNSFLAIGECGLDKVCNVDFNIQLKAFKQQINLSEKYHKPLILHIVKSFNEIIQLRIATKAKQKWIVHGFNGSYQIAKQLIDMGFYISFGHKLYQQTSKASKSIKHLPLNRIFLETDNSEFAIEEVYALAAERLNIDVSLVQRQLLLNFIDIFP